MKIFAIYQLDRTAGLQVDSTVGKILNVTITECFYSWKFVSRLSSVSIEL